MTSKTVDKGQTPRVAAVTAVSTRLSGEDLSFWWLDSPMQPTTMAMLMVLDRAPSNELLRSAFERAVAAVPRLAQRIADAPFGLTLPRWESDPTFDLDYHLRRHELTGSRDIGELFHEIAPVYETAFDRSRPLWEARVYDGLRPDNRAALFFKLHHAVADGVGGNAIFAAMTDAQREGAVVARAHPSAPSKGQWPAARPLVARVIDALRDRTQLDFERISAIAESVAGSIQHPERVGRLLQALRSALDTASFDSRSPLKQAAGRARRLSGTDLPFAEVRAIRESLGGSMIDVVLTIMARAMGKWYTAHAVAGVRELMTLVPVNLRKPEEWADKPNVGNVATGILLPLPIRLRSPLAAHREIHKRMQAKKADPLSNASPAIAELLSALPRPLVSWMAEATFGSVDFIVTNVPGILVPRYLAGAEILTAYPFAPVAMKSPVSVALYGYRDRLFVGLNSDEALMPDVEAFQRTIHESFAELRAAARRRGGKGRGELPRGGARAYRRKPKR